MRIIVNFRQDYDKDRPVATYASAVYTRLFQMGHEVRAVGEGQKTQLEDLRHRGRGYDLFLDIDNGRSKKGTFGFVYPDYTPDIPTAVWFIDSHGQPDLHQRIAGKYTHVFFAVWDKRDLFSLHRSAHWCPNATELDYFPFAQYDGTIDFGFFGSKGGLDRADVMKEIAAKNGWSTDVRQVNGAWKHKFPHTGEAMGKCRVLFNHGQKHDGPNLRVMESMAVGRPLITDLDRRSGMDKLFEKDKHYLGYESPAELEYWMKWALDNPDKVKWMANRAYQEVCAKHTIQNRVDQILEVVNG
jgi:hypothetical protein